MTHLPHLISGSLMASLMFLMQSPDRAQALIEGFKLLEGQVLARGWPLWSLRSIEILSLLVAIVFVLQFVLVGPEQTLETTSASPPKAAATATLSFRIFQAKYLSVYLIVMLADWLQGTNMYTLYSSYKVDIGTLFLTGFLSSAVFGTFLGVYVDRWGRKLGCIIFCVLEIVINLLEHRPNMPELLVGRILGGLSTSLLFSAFESWMVTEHRKRGFDEELLASTFAISSWGNGVVAICAGFLAQLASDAAGDIGPFQLAIALTAVALLLILLFWTENKGEKHSSSSNDSGSSIDSSSSSNSTNGAAAAPVVVEEEDVSTIWSSIVQSGKTIMTHPKMLCLGLSQAFFEGAVYTFVFMWVPSMSKVLGSFALLPTGLVFSCFMLSMTIGGMLFPIFLRYSPRGAEGLCEFVYFVAAASMLVPMLTFDFAWVFCSFLVLEAMVGMFNSCGAMLRSRHYPEAQQSSIMSVFRLPLNLLVVVGTKLTPADDSDVSSYQFVFGVCVAMHLTAMILQTFLRALTSTNLSADKKKTKEQ